MDAGVQVVYARTGAAQRAPLWARGLALLIALGCLTVLALAAAIPPSPSGVGTHAASLGLQPCQFLSRTGLPCPSCGMTTSFAWFARGNLLASAYVQPMGTVLAVLAACCVWGGLYTAATGRPVYLALARISGKSYLLLLIFAALAWGWKIFIHLHGIDGWRSALH